MPVPTVVSMPGIYRTAGCDEDRGIEVLDVSAIGCFGYVKIRS